MLNLNYHPKIISFIEGLQPKHFKQVWLAVLSLQKQPSQNDVINLQGYSGLKRKDVGEYRIVFEHDDSTLFIWVIGKRNDDDVYKLLARLKG